MFFTQKDKDRINAQAALLTGDLRLLEQGFRKRLEEYREAGAEAFATLETKLKALESSVESLKSCRAADLDDRVQATKAQREFENRTIARLGALESKYDSVVDNADAIVDSVVEFLITELLEDETPDRKVPSNGKSNSRGVSKQRTHKR